MILINIINTNNLDFLILNINTFLNKIKELNNQYDLIIYSNETPKENCSLNIQKYDIEHYFYKHINDTNYNYIIEINDLINLNFILSYKLESIEYINCNVINNNIGDYFSIEDQDKFNKINKHFNKNINNFSNSIKIYNVKNLKKINWFNTMDYIYNKCIELNININNQKLIILYQLLYPQYIHLEDIQHIDIQIEHPNDIQINKIDIQIENPNDIQSNDIDIQIENLNDTDIQIENTNDIQIIKSDIWLLKKSSCKRLLNNYVLTIENTVLKKNSVKENKYDPTDKISVGVGKKFKLINHQYLHFFYIVT
jgi:hypothetical protein